ncbi:ABC transporter ATP-binding protein [Arthrobacter sp. ISL-30]|uniref:ABC transporter ATP-binding protein n=1 Tax=Arthrobacter sp. ISL-30 TaxID=2819109 RepID=UPI001BE76F38|nr:ABC transporter ATP-binding protein [Arthrobacter sp. ISL-30]MBT2513390.1 ABC transporter ATP-binding protein [Arthrobacter sp. ISL-30]
MTAAEGVDVDGLVVLQGDFVLGPVSMRLNAGGIHCLLGPNGAGKTTLIRAVMGLQNRSAGDIRINGIQVAGRSPKVLRGIGLVPDDPKQLLEELTAREFWALTARLHVDAEGRDAALARAEELADFLQFTPPADTISTFSLGMRKKTQLVAALLHAPKFLILDEPRNGLDPLGMLRMESLLVEHARSGATVLVASHDLHWAERFAGHILILNQGLLEASGTVAELISPSGSLEDAFFRIVSGK